MDAGLSAMNNNNQSYLASARVQMRNQLLNSDIGNIDVKHEVPSAPDNNHQQYYPNIPPQQQQQQAAYMQPDMYPPQQQQQQHRYHNYQQQQQQQQQHQKYAYQEMQYPRMPAQLQMNHLNPRSIGVPRKIQNSNFDQPERRAYSLNQKSLSNFFKHKGSRLPYGKGKSNNGDDEEDDVIVDDANASTLTFNDIRTLGNKGGEKYGYGGDTAPMIPTLMTKANRNMNNVEYRKHMTAQKKSTMNAVAKQNKGVPDSRAMSLQGYNSGSPFAQQYPLQGGAPYNQSRANSLMRGPPAFQQPPPNGYQPHIAPAHGHVQAGGPRAMSLMTPQGRPAMNVMRPLVQQQQQNGYPIMTNQVQMQNASSSSEDLSRLDQKPGFIGSSSDSSSRSDPALLASHIEQPISGNSEHVNMSYTASPLKNRVNNAPSSEKAQLNVLKLSAPQQNDLEEKERLLAEREKELKDKERLIKERESKIQNEIREKEPRKKLLLQQEEQQKGIREQHFNKPDFDELDLDPSPILETGLQPLSLKAAKSDNISNPVDAQNRVSTATFVSTFSDSPQKNNEVTPSTGMYKLEKTDNNVFVTAQEFPDKFNHNNTINDANHSNNSNNSNNSENGMDKNHSPDTSTDSVNDGNSTLKGFTIPERDPKRSQVISSAPDDSKSKKRASFIKAKNFLRKISSNSTFKENDPQLALKKSPTNISMGSIPSSNADTFLYKKHAQKDTDNRSSVGSFSSNKWVTNSAQSTRVPSRREHPGSSNSQTNNSSVQSENSLMDHYPANDHDGFVFDNTAGKPYEPLFAHKSEIVEGNKFKTIMISGEQLNIITENSELMSELTLVSMELAESIKREATLEERLRSLDQELFQKDSPLSFSDFEIELRKKSSKIVELIQQLNNERLKRFIAEEQLLLQENGVQPSSMELVHKITELNAQLEAKDIENSMLRGQFK